MSNDNKYKANILYSKIAKPVFEMAFMYESSSTFVENKLVDKKVIKAFSDLKKALEQQLNKYRK